MNLRKSIFFIFRVKSMKLYSWFHRNFYWTQIYWYKSYKWYEHWVCVLHFQWWQRIMCDGESMVILCLCWLFFTVKETDPSALRQKTAFCWITRTNRIQFLKKKLYQIFESLHQWRPFVWGWSLFNRATPMMNIFLAVMIKLACVCV